MPWRMRPSGSLSVFKTARKWGEQPAVSVFKREVLLVVAHDGDQDLGGQREKLGIEAPKDNRREFGEVDDGVEQRLVFAPARTWDGAGGSVERLANTMFAVGRTDGDGTLRES